MLEGWFDSDQFDNAAAGAPASPIARSLNLASLFLADLAIEHYDPAEAIFDYGHDLAQSDMMVDYAMTPHPQDSLHAT